MTTAPSTLEDLQAFLDQLFPGAKVSADTRTWEVIIHTNRFLKSGDATNQLVSKAEREADYQGEEACVIELGAKGFGRERGTFYFVEDGEPYATHIKDARRFHSRQEAGQAIEDAGNMMAEDEPRIRRIQGTPTDPDRENPQ